MNQETMQKQYEIWCQRAVEDADVVKELGEMASDPKAL